MKMLFYDPIDILGLGFVLGFITIIIILLVAHLTGKSISFRKSMIPIAILLIIIYTPPLKEISKIWVILSLLVLAMLINSVLNSIYLIVSNLYNKSIDNAKAEKISQLIYISLFIFGVGIIISGSVGVISYTYHLTKQLIILTVGIWLAFRLLYQKPPDVNPL